MRRWLLSLSAVALVTGFIATPVASAQQSINLYVGGFTMRPEDSRDANDVLVRTNRFLDFHISHFNGVDVRRRVACRPRRLVRCGARSRLSTRTP